MGESGDDLTNNRKICEAYKLAHRTADESAAKGGRTYWSLDDWLAAIREYDRVMEGDDVEIECVEVK